MAIMTEPSPVLLTITTAHIEDVTVLDVVGELDLCSGHLLRDTVGALVGGGRNRIVLDLSGLAFCDAAGLSALLACRRHVAGPGGWLRLEVH
jgi:anti-sigma B factor antagonist